MASALEGFLRLDCDETVAGWLRAEVEAAQGVGHDRFGFNLFDIELFYSENRVRISENTWLEYEDAELSLTDFLAAIPDVPPGERMPCKRGPDRVFIGLLSGPPDIANPS